MGPAIVGIPILVKLYLGGTASDFALVEAFVGLGMLIGTATVYKIGHKFNHGTLFLLGLFIDGASFCFYYFIETLEITKKGIPIPWTHDQKFNWFIVSTK